MDIVNHIYLDDMEKYDKNFNKDLYENRAEQEVISEFREFYAKNLPVDLLTWCRVNEPPDKMLWKKNYWNQIMFIRDTLNYVFYDTYKSYSPVMVINTHTSKSIKLPVYEIDLKEYGIKLILRNNFYDWKVSVISEKPIEVDFKGLFNKEEVISSCYCEGFNSNQVYGSFTNNKKQFTIEISNNYKLYTFTYLLNNYLSSNNK